MQNSQVGKLFNLRYFQGNFSIAVVFLFLFIFGPSVDFLPVTTARLVWGVMFLYVAVKLFSRLKDRYVVPNSLSIVIFILLLLSIISLSFNIIHGTNDYTLRNAYLGILVESLFGSLLFYYIFLKGKDFFYFIKLIASVAFMQSLIIIIMLLDSSFREFIFNISIGTQESLFDRYGGFRGLGFAHSVTYDLAIFLSIALIFINYYVVSCNMKISVLAWVVVYAVIVIATLLTGRSGWLGILFSLFIIIFSIKKYSSIKYIFSLSVFVSFFSFVLFSVFYQDPVFQRVYGYAFEMFINLFYSGALSTGSSDVLLKQMYFFPSDSTFWFGDGYWVNPFGDGYYMHTDAGFMRHILFYGIFPSIILYGLYAFVFVKIFSIKLNRIFFYFIIFIFLIFIAGQFKGNFLIGSAMNVKLLFLLFVFAIYHKHFATKVLK